MVTFEFPAYNPAHSMTLRNPDPQDSVAIDLDVVINATRDNNIYTTIKTNQLEARSTVLTFSGIDKKDIENIENFIRASRGHYLRYTDYSGHQYICRVVDQQVTIEAATPIELHTFNLTLVKWERNFVGLPHIDHFSGDTGNVTIGSGDGSSVTITTSIDNSTIYGTPEVPMQFIRGRHAEFHFRQGALTWRNNIWFAGSGTVDGLPENCYYFVFQGTDHPAGRFRFIKRENEVDTDLLDIAQIFDQEVWHRIFCDWNNDGNFVIRVINLESRDILVDETANDLTFNNGNIGFRVEIP
jgi:hypothetical protein